MFGALLKKGARLVKLSFGVHLLPDEGKSGGAALLGGLE